MCNCYEILCRIRDDIKKTNAMPKIFLIDVKVLTDLNLLRALKFGYKVPSDFVSDQNYEFYLNKIITEENVNLYYVLALCMREHPVIRSCVSRVIKQLTYDQI